VSTPGSTAPTPGDERMPLPSFLGIGVPRAGTTWLHELLGSHSEVYVPSRRKELSYFDLHYERGVNWYRKFFPPERELGRYRAIGEITPYYCYCEACPARIAGVGIEKLVLILRHPVDRAWSYYGQKIRNGMFRGSFEEFLEQPQWPVIDQGHYSRYLKRYLQHFDRQQILVLLFEEALSDLATTKRVLANFLGISPSGFGTTDRGDPVNPSYVPRSPLLYGIAFRISKVCRRYDLDWVVNAAKRLGVREAFGATGKLRPMEIETRTHLDRLFQPEISELERLLDRRLDVWRRDPAAPIGDQAPTPALTDRGHADSAEANSPQLPR
jgi:hypothetical protein